MASEDTDKDPRIDAIMKVVEQRYPELGEALFESDVEAIIQVVDATRRFPSSGSHTSTLPKLCSKCDVFYEDVCPLCKEDESAA